MKIEDNLHKELLVERVRGRSKSICETFDGKIGTIMLNDEGPEDRYYEYMIYFPCINNSFLCAGDHEIEAYSREEYPERFL